MFDGEDFFLNLPICVANGAPLSFTLRGSVDKVDYCKPYPHGPEIIKSATPNTVTEMKCVGCVTPLEIPVVKGGSFIANPIISTRKNVSIIWVCPAGLANVFHEVCQNLKLGKFSARAAGPGLLTNKMCLVKSNAFGNYHRAIVLKQREKNSEVYFPDKGIFAEIREKSLA